MPIFLASVCDYKLSLKWNLTKLSPEGGNSAFWIISALTKPELYCQPSPGLSTVYHSLNLEQKPVLFTVHMYYYSLNLSGCSACTASNSFLSKMSSSV